MERNTALLLIALLLLAYGVYHALYAIAMLPAAALLLLGASVAATALVEAFVLGIIGWLYALLIAIAAIVVALLLGAYVDRSDPLQGRRGGSPQA